MLVLVVLGWSSLALLSARTDLREAETALTALRAGADDPEQVSRALAGVEQRLARAHDRLRAPGPRLLGAVPVLGQVVDGPRVVAAAGEAVAGAGRATLEATASAPLFEAGTVSLAQLAEVREALAAAARRTRDPVSELMSVRTGLVPEVTTGVRRAQQALGRAPSSFAGAAEGLSALDGVLGGSGDRSVLIVLMNNTEQRGGGGVATVFAQGTANNGRLELEAFADVFDVADPPETARQVPAPADYSQLWGPFLADTTLWRNALMSPHLPASLQVLAGASRASTDAPTDVVVALDVRAIAAVLRATGPAELPDGSPLTAENAVQELLLDAYTRFPDDATGQGERRRVLRAAADVVVERLLGGAGPTTSLAAALSGAAHGRHLAVWSARPEEQTGLEGAGLAGQVLAEGGDLVQVATQNFGQSSTEGNKLDYFARRFHRVRVDVRAGRADVEQIFTLRNGAPPTGLPGYVLGYSRPGELTSLVTLAVPESAQISSFSRDGTMLAFDPARQTDHVVLRDLARLPPGASATWQVRYSLPLEDDHYRLAVVPQALAFDADLDLTVRSTNGAVLRAVSPGSLVKDGAVTLNGPLDGVEKFAVHIEQAPFLRRARDAVRRFWTEPVQLP